jgi:uncharacterized protein YecE (DUF72 family)
MIRVGVGGWTFAPWRNNFYPAKLPHKDELSFASRNLTTIEINGTFYRTQSPASFAKWREETPEGFVFAVKGHRGVVNQSRLREAGEAIGWFLASGIMELGDKLGPLLWQLAPHKQFDRDDIGGFFRALPADAGGRRLMHAIEPRHDSFKDPGFVELARENGVAIVYADSPKYPAIADLSGSFVYARLQSAAAEEPEGYAPAALDLWAKRATDWQKGASPKDLPLVAKAAAKGAREVFLYMINGAKERAPAAAMALIRRVNP